MRAHGIKLPAPTKSASSATLDFKGLDTHSARYKRAVAACARALLGKLHAKRTNGGSVRLSDIHIQGIKLKSIHIGHIEIPALHLPKLHLKGITVPKIHVTAPPLSGGSSGSGGGGASGEPEASQEPEGSE
jgi:hypothetical protein